MTVEHVLTHMHSKHNTATPLKQMGLFEVICDQQLGVTRVYQ